MNYKKEKIFLVFLIVLSLSLVFLSGTVANSNPGIVVFLLAVSFTACFVAGILLYDSGNGVVKGDREGDFDLPVNEVYETVGVVKIVGISAENDSYVAILKNRKGKLLAYQLKQSPPKCFKKTADKTNPYVVYPPVK